MPTIDYSKLLWTPFGNSPTNTLDRNNAPLPGLSSRSVQTFRVDQNGNPIIPAAPGAIPAPNAADARSEQNLTRQNMWFTSSAPGGPSPAPQQTAQRQQVPNNWGTSIGRMMDPIWENNDPGTIMTAAALPQIPGPSGYSNLNKSQDRLGAGTGLAFAGDEQQQNPALGAINQAAGMPPMPRARPPLPPMPFSPSPNLRSSPSDGAIGDSYTIRKGDTLSGIAKKSGLSLNSILAMNPNISDPNRIMAGNSLNLGTLVPTNESLPGSSTPLYRRAGAPLPKVPARNGGFLSGPPSQRYEKAVKRAERFTNLDQFGNII